MAVQHGRREFWEAHVEAWQDSGLTQRAYCREHQLPETQLSHWKHRLEKLRRRQGDAKRLVPIQVIGASVTDGRPAEIEPPRRQDAPDSHLTLVLGNGLRLEIGEEFNPSTLSRVLEVLGHVG